ncbi:hypothetical protein CANINC_003610 [Pichia inconspicua]|uniref:Thioesterase domain-containing protein n=1 Tax=Pichia inconspicua TaxID=52247 RepID=A0A4T0WYA0_9ASCO|nr:hypothetical protein CANINC_003610 [[Candida] inconspicua]
MGIFSKFVRGTFRGGLYLTSLGAGFALCARPWPDSPLFAKPMELVKEKRSRDNLIQHFKSKGYDDVTMFDDYQRILNNENFRVIELDQMIPEAHRYNQVTQGLLNLNNPIVLINRKEGELVMFGKADNENIIGHDNKVHNGIITILLDETTCFCGFDKLPSKRGVTAKLDLNFYGKIQPNSRFVLKTKVEEARGRKVTIKGTVISAEGDRLADAKCLLVEPRWFKYFNWVELF